MAVFKRSTARYHFSNTNAKFKVLKHFVTLVQCFLQAKQCNQIANIFCNIWPFTAIKMCPIAY